MKTHTLSLLLIAGLILPICTSFAQNSVLIEAGYASLQSLGKNSYFYNGNLALGTTDFSRAKLTITGVPDGIFGLSVKGSLSNDSKTRVSEYLNSDFSYLSSGSSAQFQFSRHTGAATFEIDAFNHGKQSSGNISIQANSTGFVGLGTSTPRAKLHLAGGDLYIDNPSSNLILKSQNGSCFKLIVDNFGGLSTQQITCP